MPPSVLADAPTRRLPSGGVVSSCARSATVAARCTCSAGNADRCVLGKQRCFQVLVDCMHN